MTLGLVTKKVTSLMNRLTGVAEDAINGFRDVENEIIADKKSVMANLSLLKKERGTSYCLQGLNFSK